MSIIQHEYAYTNDGKSIHISKVSRGDKKTYLTCQDGHRLYPRKGDKVAHHFYHAKTAEGNKCTRISGKSKFHRQWQEFVPDGNKEIRMAHGERTKIADIKTDDDLVIEIQHSNIEKETIKEREEFYDNMIWIFELNKKPPITNTGFFKRSECDKYYHCNKPVYLDTGEKMLQLYFFEKCYIYKGISYSKFFKSVNFPVKEIPEHKKASFENRTRKDFNPTVYYEENKLILCINGLANEKDQFEYRKQMYESTEKVHRIKKRCKDCNRRIDDKYTYCYDCNFKRLKQGKNITRLLHTSRDSIRDRDSKDCKVNCNCNNDFNYCKQEH